jgi:hypothetical protein
MNNLILAASQTEGFKDNFDTSMDVFSSPIAFAAAGITIIICIVIAIKSKEISYGFLGLLTAGVVYLMATLALLPFHGMADARDKDAAFIQWAKERYSVELTSDQVDTLYESLSTPANRPDDYKPVVIEGNMLSLTYNDEFGLYYITVEKYAKPQEDIPENELTKDDLNDEDAW